jgi:hypothetical protein
MATEQIEERQKALKVMQRKDYIPESMKLTEKDKHIRINIGGLMFESPQSILMRDKNSLLAALCQPEPPLLPDPEGFFFFERDWWLFRYILDFLRDGSLPEDRSLLARVTNYSIFFLSGLNVTFFVK